MEIIITHTEPSVKGSLDANALNLDKIIANSIAKKENERLVF